MLQSMRSNWALFLGIALIMLGNGLQGSLVGVRATLEDFPTAVTGIVMSGYFIGFLAGSFVTTRMVERVGHVRVFGAMASLASTAVLIHAVVVEPVTWMAMRLVIGFSYAGLYVVAESWLNDKADNETRGQLLAIYMVIVLAGMAGGQGLLNVAAPGGPFLFILTSVLISLALVPMLLTASPAPEFSRPTRVSVGQLAQISPLGVAGAWGTGMAHGALFGMGAVYARESGLSVSGVSLFMGVAIAGGMIWQWPIGRFSDHYDRRLVLTVVTFAAAVFALGAIAFGQSLWLLLAFVGLFGGMCLPMYSLCVAHTNDFLEPEQLVAASSGLYMVVGLGASLGPLAASAVMWALGPDGFFVFMVAVHGTIGLFALYRMTRRAAVPLEDQEPLLALPAQVSPVAATLASDNLDDGQQADPDGGEWKNQ